MSDGGRARFRRRAMRWALIGLTTCWAASGVSLAQTPPLPPAAAALGEPGLGVAAPLQVDRVRFDGARSVPLAELDRIAAPFTGRALRALELEELRQRITRAYIERGFINSGALLRDDAWRDGTLTLSIIEGQVSRVQLNGLQGLADTYLASRLVREGEALDVNRLQDRFQLLLADPLFKRLNVRLVPEEGLGRSVLDIDVTRARPWSIGAFAHNHVAPAVGAQVGGIEGSVRNITGWGDSLSGQVQSSDGTLGHDIAWTLPLFAQQTLATLRWSRTRSSVTEEPVRELDIDSRVSTREASLFHPFVDEARLRYALGITHALRTNRTRLGGEPFSFTAGIEGGITRVESFRLTQEVTVRLERHVFALRASALSGRNNVDPELDVGERLPLPSKRYRMLQLQWQAAFGLGADDRQLVLRGQFQRTPDRLVAMEQMAIGGRYTVRGYRENTLVRDNAASFSAELHWPLWRDEAQRQHVKLIPFADAGTAANVGGERKRLASAGLGLVIGVADVEAELFWAKRLESRPVDTRGDPQDRGFHIALRYRPSF